MRAQRAEDLLVHLEARRTTKAVATDCTETNAELHAELHAIANRVRASLGFCFWEGLWTHFLPPEAHPFRGFPSSSAYFVATTFVVAAGKSRSSGRCAAIRMTSIAALPPALQRVVVSFQRSHMPNARDGRPLWRVAALERTHHSSATPTLRALDQESCQPLEMLVLERESAEGIATQ